MNRWSLYLILFLIFFTSTCRQGNPTSKLTIEEVGKGALVTTHFKSFEEFKAVVQLEYAKDQKSWVKLTHENNGKQVTSWLKKGISETDIVKARDGGLWKKISLSLSSPFFVANRKDLLRVYILSRRKQLEFGEGDIAFYDLAKKMLENIEDEDRNNLSEEDQSDKGYINTFNHVNAQSFMTTLFSEELADFVADTHERKNMPELISGRFTEEQLSDIKNGPVDNYVDIINNEWGQELGKMLKKKYNINRSTNWTPQLMSDYLNDLQSYYSWNFQMGFRPFKKDDQIVLRFSNKLQSIMNDLSSFD